SSVGGGPVHPAGGVTTTWAVAGPVLRLVTVIVKWPAPPVAGRPSTGHTTRSGVTATSNGWVTKIGRRTSPISWSRERYTTSRRSVIGAPAIVSRNVTSTGRGSHGKPRQAARTPVPSHSAPVSGRRTQYGGERGAP